MEKFAKQASKFWIFLIILAVLVIVGTTTYFIKKRNTASQLQNVTNNSQRRQAVFLTNGQVYFGYISNINNQIVTLKDIYYLKTKADLQNNSTDQSNSKVSLIKLGSELHGPEDAMYINRDQILFFEDMKDSSKISDAINKFSSQNQ